jgi:hypothetical protein
MKEIFSKKIILILVSVVLIVGISLTTFLFLREKKEAKMLRDYIERLKKEGAIVKEGETPLVGIPPLTPELERAVKRKIEEIAERLVKEGWNDEIRKEMGEIAPLATWVDKELFDKAREKCLAKKIDFGQPLLGLEKEGKRIPDVANIITRYVSCEAISKENIDLCTKVKELGEREYEYCKNSYAITILPSILTKKSCEENEIKACSDLIGFSREDCLALCQGLVSNDEGRCRTIENNEAKITCLAIVKNNFELFNSIEEKDIREGSEDLFYLIKSLQERNKEYLENISLNSYFYRALPLIQEIFKDNFSCQDFVLKDYKRYCYESFPQLTE